MTPGAPDACPVCGEARAPSFVESWRDPLDGVDYRLWRCPACSVVFADPFRHPGAEWYARYSSADSYEGSAAWRFEWFLSLDFRRGGRLLDVGCGSGRFLELARRAGYEAFGSDPNPEAVRGARERGLEVRLGGLPEFSSEEGRFDVITLFDVLEHLDDPGATVELARLLLKPGGGLVVTTPNDLRPNPFGRDAFDYPPHHLTRWTPRALEAFLRVRRLRPERSYHTRLVTLDYSRFFVGRATDAVLAAVKRLLYGRAASGTTLTRLIDVDASPRGARGLLLGLIRGKGARMRLVRWFQACLGWALAPLFLPLKLYYRATIPGAGSTNCLLAVKEPDAS